MGYQDDAINVVTRLFLELLIILSTYLVEMSIFYHKVVKLTFESNKFGKRTVHNLQTRIPR